MDTTGHDFIWELDTLGFYGELNDVAALAPDNVWVVGEIRTEEPDTVHNLPYTVYNAAHWDGYEWALNKLPAVTYSGSISQMPLTSIYAISPEGIWCSAYAGSYVYWNGQEWASEWVPEMNGVINAIWGTSSSDVYFVGGNGSIVHYDGSSFTIMDSPTSQDLNGIVGVVNPEANAVRLWAYGWTDYPHRGLLLEFDENTWNIVWNETQPFYDDHNYLEPTVWATNDYVFIYTGGRDDGMIARHKIHDFNDYEILYHTINGFIRDIHGNNKNDIFFVGDFNNVMHYNGSTFHTYPELAGNSRFLAVQQIGDYVFIIHSSSAVVIRGIRVP
ncbi:MAG: hypothetical protein D6732_24355 [Methanobacteriota archaeon]|nr:MAG: hypothetical protein D6732_24355 [Euryarchaeota archaeon]